MTTTPAPLDPEADLSTATSPDLAAPLTKGGSPDPITGEPDAHPVGVGVGAGVAGALGAAIGAVAGPVGVIVGAAIGAIAGGLAGKEVAESPEVSPTLNEGVPLDDFDHAATDATANEEPLSASLADRLTPPEDAFFTGGTLSGKDPDRVEDALDDFDRPRPASPYYADLTDDPDPLPTASSGLVTPDESSLFADSTTGQSSVLAESPFPAAYAVSPGDHFADTPVSASAGLGTDDAHAGTEHTIRSTAYYRYLDREAAGQPGSDFEDWIEAEKAVLKR